MTKIRLRQAAPIAIILALFGCWLYVNNSPVIAAQQAETIQVDTEVDPVTGFLNEDEFEVQITVSGDSSICPPTTPVPTPLDIILVVDGSSSMDEETSAGNSESKIDAAKGAINSFLDQVNLNQNRVALIRYDESASTLLSFSNDRDALRNAVNSLGTFGGTSISAGIEAARRLFERDGLPDNKKVIVLLADGQGGSGDLGARAKQEGSRIFTIGLGVDVEPDTLRAIASRPEDYYETPDGAALQQIYSDIATSLPADPIAAGGTILRQRINNSAFELVPSSITASGVMDNAGTISWDLGDIRDGAVTVSYRVRPLAPGVDYIVNDSTVEYNRCGSEPFNQSLGRGMSVTIQQRPTETPTPTPTASPTPTPIPTRAPTATPAPEPPVDPIKPITHLLCNPLPWLPLFFGLVLLLFMLWWLWQVIKELQKPEEERDLCRWIPWLFLPLTWILIWLILSQIDLCNIRESVYFWRIDPASGAGQIYVTDRDGVRPVQSFAAINENYSCVGCHTVSSAGNRLAAIAEGANGPVVVYDLSGEQLPVPEVRGAFTAWSPDGNRLAVATVDGDIVILDIPSQSITPLTGANQPGVLESMPAWSPDGQTIAFVRGASGSTYALEGDADIYTVPAIGGNAQPLTGASGDGMSYYPAYSPDGRWLAFTHHDGNVTYAAPQAEIFLVSATGGDPILIQANDTPEGMPLTNVSNSWPTWSLDGRYLAFNSKRNDAAYDLFFTEIDENGGSGPARPLVNASNPGIFEHLPFWGVPPKISPWPAILALWPYLFLYLLIWFLWWLCRRRPRPEPIVEPAAVVSPPGPLEPFKLDPLWQVAPTLILGVGGTGRWVLTHLKKTLQDGGLGTLPEDVRFALLDTSESEEVNVLRDFAGETTRVEFAGVSLDPEEVLLIGGNLSGLMTATKDAALKGWFPHDAYRSLSEQEKDLSRGTGGRRPLVKAGFINKLRQGISDSAPEQQYVVSRDARELWQLLVDACQTVLGDRRIVRIVVVGSLSGGMSGVLVDLAYLARRAGHTVIPTDGSVFVEGYFTTPDVVRNLALNRDRLEINAFSALRELQRFQLMQGFSVPMDYTASGYDSAEEYSHLRDVCDWRLFDNVSLLGSDGYPEIGVNKSTEPWATVYASLADLIAFRLDQGSKAGEAGDYRSTDATTRQSQWQRAVISTAGSFVYRLPLKDILHLVQTRWIRKLYYLFLSGEVPPNATTSSITFNWENARLKESPEEAAQTFTRGQHEAGGAPEGMRLVDSLANGGKVLARDAIKLAEEADTYQAYLYRALSLILNGKVSESGLIPHGPRLGYATAFADRVHQTVQAALRQAQNEQTNASELQETRSWWQNLLIWFGFGRASRQEWQEIVTRLTQWSQLTEQSYRSMQIVPALLGDRIDQQQTGQMGLGTLLGIRHTEAEQRRQQMDRVGVRRYLWERPADDDSDQPVDLATEWYDAVDGKLAENLRRLHWFMTPDGSMHLGLVLYQNQTAQLMTDEADDDNVERFADALQELAGHVTQEWARKVTLADVLLTQLDERLPEPARSFVRDTWTWAKPHLKPGESRVNQAATGIPGNVASHSDELLQRLPIEFEQVMNRLEADLDPGPTKVMQTTDRTALTLIREHMLMTLDTLPEMQELFRTYQRNAGTDVTQGVDSPLLTTVFAAEREAMAYEQRLEYPELLNQDFRLLHPLIVLGLSRPELAELYALAFAAGWVERRLDRATLKLPESEPIQLSLPDRVEASGGLDPYVAGYLRLTMGLAEDADWVNQLQRLFETPLPKLEHAWRTYLARFQPDTLVAQRLCPKGDVIAPGDVFCAEGNSRRRSGDKFCRLCALSAEVSPSTIVGAQAVEPTNPFANEPQAVQDLAAIAALAAHRRLAPEEWARLVMTRSRMAL